MLKLYKIISSSLWIFVYLILLLLMIYSFFSTDNDILKTASVFVIFWIFLLIIHEIRRLKNV